MASPLHTQEREASDAGASVHHSEREGESNALVGSGDLMHSQFPQLREQQALRLEQEARQQVTDIEFRARAILEEQRCANCRSGEFQAQHARGDGGEYRTQFVNMMRSCAAKVNTAKTRDMSSSN